MFEHYDPKGGCVMFILLDNKFGALEIMHHIHDKYAYLNRLRRQAYIYEYWIECGLAISYDSELSQLRDEREEIMAKPEYTYDELVTMFGIDRIAYRSHTNYYFTATAKGIRKCLPSATGLDNSILVSYDELEEQYKHYKSGDMTTRPYIVALYEQVVKKHDCNLTPSFIVNPATL
jgi:hypothetical protein